MPQTSKRKFYLRKRGETPESKEYFLVQSIFLPAAHIEEKATVASDTKSILFAPSRSIWMYIYLLDCVHYEEILPCIARGIPPKKKYKMIHK